MTRKRAQSWPPTRVKKKKKENLFTDFNVAKIEQIETWGAHVDPSLTVAQNQLLNYALDPALRDVRPKDMRKSFYAVAGVSFAVMVVGIAAGIATQVMSLPVYPEVFFGLVIVAALVALSLKLAGDQNAESMNNYDRKMSAFSVGQSQKPKESSLKSIKSEKHLSISDTSENSQDRKGEASNSKKENLGAESDQLGAEELSADKLVKSLTH